MVFFAKLIFVYTEMHKICLKTSLHESRRKSILLLLAILNIPIRSLTFQKGQ